MQSHLETNVIVNTSLPLPMFVCLFNLYLNTIYQFAQWTHYTTPPCSLFIHFNVFLVPVALSLSLHLQRNGDRGSPRWSEARLRRQISHSYFSSNFSGDSHILLQESLEIMRKDYNMQTSIKLLFQSLPQIAELSVSSV